MKSLNNYSQLSLSTGTDQNSKAIKHLERMTRQSLLKQSFSDDRNVYVTLRTSSKGYLLYIDFVATTTKNVQLILKMSRSLTQAKERGLEHISEKKKCL